MIKLDIQIEEMEIEVQDLELAVRKELEYSNPSIERYLKAHELLTEHNFKYKTLLVLKNVRDNIKREEL